MEWNYLDHGDDTSQSAGIRHSTQVFEKYRDERPMFTDDGYSQDLSFYGSGQEAQKDVFGGEISEQRSIFGWNSDQDIYFEKAQDTQNMFTEYSEETKMDRSLHETYTMSGVHVIAWTTTSTVSNRDNIDMSYDDHQCHYLINTTAGGAYVTVNDGQRLTQDGVTSAGNEGIVNSVPTRSKSKERMYARRLGNCPDENQRIRNASRAHMNRVKKANEMKQMEADTAKVRRQIAFLKQMKERQEATNEWLEYELHLRSANQ
jgi:hypothetical protein